MGTDIHFYVERRDKGKWVTCDTWEDVSADWLEDGEAPYKTVPYGKHFYDGRNYDLFAMLADVRNGRGFAGLSTGSGFVPVAEPRGLPDDLSSELKDEADRRLEHSPSWLLVSELLAYDWTQETTKTGVVSAEEFAQWIAWDRGCGRGPKSYSGGIFGASIKMVSASEMERLVAECEAGAKDAMRKPQNVPIREEIGRMLGNHYCRVEWKTTYYREASKFLSECMPRLWRLGRPEDVRCVFWFDS